MEGVLYYIIVKCMPLFLIGAAVDYSLTAFSDPGYTTSLMWLLTSTLGFFCCSGFGPIVYYLGKVVCSAGIAGALASIVYHLIGKTASIIVFIILLALLILYLYMRRNNASNWDDLRYNKGKAYYEKALQTVDKVQRQALLKKSAARDYIPGCTGYGTMLCQSRSSADRKKGIKILRRAAKYESVASYNLGIMYFKGAIVERDLSTALSYAENSKKLGDGRAQKLIDHIMFSKSI